jgi:hypothetical protein
MAGLLAPYVPDSSEWFKSHAQGYALGETMRNRDLRVDAGGQAAEGDMKGARSTLYEGGDFEGGNQISQMMRQASDDSLKKTERFHATLGNLALAADTPEKWAAATAAAGKAGLDVSKYGDFNSRQMVLAQSGKTIEAIALENERRKASQSTYQHTEGGAFDPRTGTLTPYPEGMAVKRTELERRAIAGGLQPGSEEYRDYVLAGPEKTVAAAKPRALSFGDTNKLAAQGGQLDSVERFNTGFKDEFAGYGRGGAAAMFLARNIPIVTGETTENAAAFWQDYDKYKNVVRNELFGSALTPGEQEEFAKADVDPNMDPKIIKKNLGRQKAIVETALSRVGSSLKASGYGQEAIEAAIGRPLDALKAGGKNQEQLPAVAGAPTSKEVVQVRSKQEYDALPPGARYLAPDGSTRTKQ